MFTPKRASRIGSRLSLSSPNRQSPGIGGKTGGNTTVPVQIAEILKNGSVGGNILNCGFACVTSADTIYCWKINNRTTVHQLPTPAGCNCQAENFAVVGASACFISPTGIGRFWPSIMTPTRWFDFQVTLDTGDAVHRLHSDVNKIGAVTKRGCLYTITVQNDVVNVHCHRLPDQRGLSARVSSYFWSSSQPREKVAQSTLSGEIFFIAINDQIYGWTVNGSSGNLKCTIPVASILDEEGDEIISLCGNDKYFGIVSKYGERMKILTYLATDFGANDVTPTAKPVGLPFDENAVLVMPYLSETAIVSSGRLWLGDEEMERLDEIICFGSFDGRVCVISQRGLKLYNTVQKLDTDTMQESMLGKESFSREEQTTLGSIQSLEQLCESENPKKRLQAAFLQHSRGNINEAEHLLSTVGDLGSAAIQLSHDMINEVPSHDPRWDNSALARSASLPGPAKSLLIQRQIADKMKMHTVFIHFIKGSLETDAIGQIGQDGEKLIVGQALRNVNSTLQPVIDRAIQVVIRQRGVRIPPALTHQDLFYSQVETDSQPERDINGNILDI